MMTIAFSSEDKEIMVKSIELQHKEIHIKSYTHEKSSIDFLSSITEDNILDLDSPEKEDLNFILHDFNLELSEEAIYQSFKKGFSEFKTIIEQTFNQKKNLKLNV